MYFNMDTNRKPSVVLLPALSSSPETGIEFGGAALISFYTDTLDRNTRVSNIFGYSTITTKGQTKLSLTRYILDTAKQLSLSGNLSFYNYPFDFYGIRPMIPASPTRLVKKKGIKLPLTAKPWWPIMCTWGMYRDYQILLPV